MTERIIRAPRFVIRAAEDLPDDLLKAIAHNPDRLVDEGEMVKDGDRTTLVRLEHAGRLLLLKRFNPKGPLHTLTHLPLRSRAAWNWRNAAMLRTAGLDTPRILAIREDRIGPLRLRSFVLTEFIESQPLLDWVRRQSSDPVAIERIAERFGAVWRGLGRNRLGHGDMKATNFLIDAGERIWLVDLDGMRRHPTRVAFNRARRRDRERFLRNWVDLRGVEATFRAQIDRDEPRGG